MTIVGLGDGEAEAVGMEGSPGRDSSQARATHGLPSQGHLGHMKPASGHQGEQNEGKEGETNLGSLRSLATEAGGWFLTSAHIAPTSVRCFQSHSGGEGEAVCDPAEQVGLPWGVCLTRQRPAGWWGQ